MKEEHHSILSVNIKKDHFTLDPAVVNKFMKLSDVLSGAPKKLSDYSEHITPEDEVFFENAKKEQLSKEFPKKQQGLLILLQMIGLGADIAVLSTGISIPDPPTRRQIYFWAMLEAFRGYMKRGSKDFKSEVMQLLIVDMAKQFCRLIVDGMNIAAEEKKRLLKRMDALEIIAQDKLNEKHPPRPSVTIQAAAAACGVDEKTIRRWEKYRRGKEGGTKPPDWYPGRNVTIVELKTRAKDARAQKRMAQATRRGVKNASRYIEEHDQSADDDE